jgi:hypothetical protein
MQDKVGNFFLPLVQQLDGGDLKPLHKGFKNWMWI